MRILFGSWVGIESFSLTLSVDPLQLGRREASRVRGSSSTSTLLLDAISASALKWMSEDEGDRNYCMDYLSFSLLS